VSRADTTLLHEASAGYAATRGIPRTPAELADHDCVLVGARSTTTWTFRSGSRDVAVPVRGRIRVDNFRVARDLARCGAGVVRVAQVFAAPLVAEGALVPVLEPHWTRVPIFAVHAGPNPPTPAVRVFIDAARAAVAASLASGWRTA
jgi:DNA-binding transcriptional LysR family regulator